MAAREHIDNQEITVSKNIKEQEENVLTCPREKVKYGREEF